jgi:hypothetical protein
MKDHHEIQFRKYGREKYFPADEHRLSESGFIPIPPRERVGTQGTKHILFT